MFIYLDYAAATPLSDAAQNKMLPYFSENFYNPSGLSLKSRQLKQELNTYRQDVASTLNTHHSNVLFTAGATEANNLILHGIAANNPGRHMLVSAIEHEAVLSVLPWLKKWFDTSWDLIPVDSKGVVDIASLKKLLTPKTELISIMHTNNETGVVQPISDIKKTVEESGLEALIHTDASQSTLTHRIHFDRFGADAITLNGGKMYGPKQSGVLVANCLSEVDPLIIGGGQEKGLRSGTESLAQIAGFTQAFYDAQASTVKEHSRLQSLQQKFEDNLTELGGTIHAAEAQRSPTITSVMFAGVDAERIIYGLEEEGIIAATGSACSAADNSGSHVLAAMGCSDEDAHSTIRFSFGASTTADKLDVAISVLSQLL